MMHQDGDGLYEVCGSPTWIHSDIMDDNVHMELCTPAHCLNGVVSGASAITDVTLDACNVEGNVRYWFPTHILDFSDLTIGKLLLDLFSPRLCYQIIILSIRIISVFLFLIFFLLFIIIF